jgi:carbon monoxide dehydrogenase subunit G
VQLEQSFLVAAAPAAAWRAFHQMDMLVSALPGAELISADADNNLKLKFRVKLGPIAANFEGSGRVTHDEATHAGVFSGEAADRKSNSRVKGKADFALVADAGGTRVNVLIDYALSGSLAQFSRGAIVRELANQMTADFAKNLGVRIAEQQADAAPAANSSVATTSAAIDAASAAAPAIHPAKLVAANGFSLLLRALGAWLKRLFASPERRG